MHAYQRETIMTMSQRTYANENQTVENASFSSSEGDYIISGFFLDVEDSVIRVPKGIELIFFSNDNYSITESFIKQLKRQNTITDLGYYKEGEWKHVTPKIYREGDCIPNYIMKAFPEGMITHVGSSQTHGINKRTSIDNLLIQLTLANNINNKLIRCFWTANKLTNQILCPKLFFK